MFNIIIGNSTNFVTKHVYELGGNAYDINFNTENTHLANWTYLGVGILIDRATDEGEYLQGMVDDPSKHGVIDLWLDTLITRKLSPRELGEIAYTNNFRHRELGRQDALEEMRDYLNELLK